MSDNGHSATDIITYIGIPLAVLGVLPILYNTFATLVNASKIKRTLRHSRLKALTRSDVVNRVIEIELPRYAVTPWDRFQHRQEYWSLSRNPSSIPGGSWTTFNWKTHAIGVKTQRLEYADQLRQPQVDVAFDELVCYLLDLGAVPDAHGWHLLRSTGLWTPVGCALMKSPDGHHNVLTVAPLDDSDGHLSLSVVWQPEWTTRTYENLPPYWVNLPAPPAETKDYDEAQGKEDEKDQKDQKDQKTESTEEAEARTEAEIGTEIGTLVGKAGPEDAKPLPSPVRLSFTAARPGSSGSNSNSLPPGYGASSSIPRNSIDSASYGAAAEKTSRGCAEITCQISIGGIVTALMHSTWPAGASAAVKPAKLDRLNIEHLRLRPGRLNGVWFASAATAYGTTSQTVLWNYRIPDDILAFARRETVPCGVLVLLGMAEESDTPEWATKHTHDLSMQMDLQMRRINQQRAAQMAEARLPPHQRDQAVRERMMQENMQRIQDMRDRSRRDNDRRQQREMEALQSPKWDARLVAEHSLCWLLKQKQGQKPGLDQGQDQGHVPVNEDLKQSAGMLLHRMVLDTAFAEALCCMMDRWKAWADIGGMKAADLAALRQDQFTFAQASLLIALVHDSSTALDGTLSVDLQECLRIWRKARLG